MTQKKIIFIATSIAFILGLGAIYSCSPSSSSGAAAAGTATITMKGAAN